MAGEKSMFVRAEVPHTGDVDGCTFERAYNESTVLLLNYQATHTTPAEPVSATPAKGKLLRFTGVYSTKAASKPTDFHEPSCPHLFHCGCNPLGATESSVMICDHRDKLPGTVRLRRAVHCPVDHSLFTLYMLA